MLLWLLVFLAVAVAIQARQTAGWLAAGRVSKLREQRQALEAERATLQRDIRVATGRKVLGATAEQLLGLHKAEDTEFVLFPLKTHGR